MNNDPLEYELPHTHTHTERDRPEQTYTKTNGYMLAKAMDYFVPSIFVRLTMIIWFTYLRDVSELAVV